MGENRWKYACDALIKVIFRDLDCFHWACSEACDSIKGPRSPGNCYILDNDGVHFDWGNKSFFFN